MPSVTINPPKTPVTKGSNTLAVATIPNICKMPGPPAPFVPTPLPNIGKSALSPADFSTTVKIEGNDVAIRGSTFCSMGDIASKGTGGGLISANCEGITKFIAPGSLDVQIEGKNVQILGDQMLNNCGPGGSPPNAATMTGASHVPGAPASPNFAGKRANLNHFMSTDKKPGSTVGDGTTAAAVHQEIATGAQVGGRWHYKKSKELANGYKKRDDDAVQEGKNGNLTKDEVKDLTDDTTTGYVRNLDAAKAAEAVPSPPWPT